MGKARQEGRRRKEILEECPKAVQLMNEGKRVFLPEDAGDNGLDERARRAESGALFSGSARAFGVDMDALPSRTSWQLTDFESGSHDYEGPHCNLTACLAFADDRLLALV